MAGKVKASAEGKKLKKRVMDLSNKLKLEAIDEVKAARRIWGAERHIDVVIRQKETGKILGIECKYQGGSGSAEEKIPATIKDIESWPIPGIVVIDGAGFSKNMEGYLMATGKVIWLDDLEEWLKLYFNLIKKP